MSNIEVILDEEIERLLCLCTHITRMAANLRIVHLPNISYSPESIESCYHSLLSMVENIEGSAILLESLLTIPQRSLTFSEKKRSKRFHYTRNELFQIRERVTLKLSNEIGNLLQQVVQRESNDAVEMERQSWRDIRTILM